MSTEKRVLEHFHEDAVRFDAIYEEQKKSAFARFVDRYVRGVVVERLHLVRALAPPPDQETEARGSVIACLERFIPMMKTAGVI